MGHCHCISKKDNRKSIFVSVEVPITFKRGYQSISVPLEYSSTDTIMNTNILISNAGITYMPLQTNLTCHTNTSRQLTSFFMDSPKHIYLL
jgi:hypothetical protein